MKKLPAPDKENSNYISGVVFKLCCSIGSNEGDHGKKEHHRPPWDQNRLTPLCFEQSV